MALFYDIAIIMFVCFCEASLPPNPNEHYVQLLSGLVEANQNRMQALDHLIRLQNQDVRIPLRHSVIPFDDDPKIYASDPNSKGSLKWMPPSKSRYTNQVSRILQQLLNSKTQEREFRTIDFDNMKGVFLPQQMKPRLDRFTFPILKPMNKQKVTYVNGDSEDGYASDSESSDYGPHEDAITLPFIIKSRSKNKTNEDDSSSDSDDIYESLHHHRAHPLIRPKTVSNSDSESDDDSYHLSDRHAITLDDNIGAEEIDKLEALKELNLTPEETQLLLRSWKGDCDKKAMKVCKKACKSAVKNFCESYDCRRGKKTLFEKQCKNSCKDKFSN